MNYKHTTYCPQSIYDKPQNTNFCILKPGKRYWWFINNYENKKKSGLFTGTFDNNGNAILITKNGENWSVPLKDLEEK